MKKIFITIIAMLLPLLASADANGTCGENLTWSYVETTKTLTISGTGAMPNYSYSNAPWDSFKSSIKNIIIELGVTSIGDCAFLGYSSLTSVTIPNSVTSIGQCAFDSCTGLTSITIPNSVTSIGWGAFIGCIGLTSIKIPNSVKIIEDWALAWCTNLTSITVEDGNQYFDSRNNCNAIIDSNNQLVVGCKNTVIPNSVTAIGWGAFYGCTGLTSVNIPNNVTSIYDGAFCYSGLVYITLPSKLTSIGDNSFQNCYGLTDIYSIATNVPNANLHTFTNPGNITLHVPSESLNSYKTAEPWNKFKSIVSLDNSDTQGGQKCSKPTISIADGKIVFSCETPDVSYQWVISTPNGTNGTDDSIWPGTLSVFATKSGYQNSDVATYTFPSLAGDVNQDGVVNVADHVKLSEIIMGKE